MWALLLVLLVPLVLVYLRHHPRQVIYRGEAIALGTMKFVDPRRRYAWVTIVVPGYGPMQANVTIARAQSVPAEKVPVHVVVCRGTIGSAWIESVSWADEGHWEHCTTHNEDGNFLLGFYVLAACVAGLMGHVLATIILVAAGLLSLAVCIVILRPLEGPDCSCEEDDEDD